MMAFSSSLSRFYSGIPFHLPLPLVRFLPPYYRQTATAYYKELVSESSNQGGLILDPFGASPFLPIELANAGAAVIVCCNNPILRGYLRVVALAPRQEEFQTVLAEISALKKLDARLETFFRSLYQSNCNNCLSEIEVDAFVWERESSNNSHRLVYKQYSCPQCGSEGLFAVMPHDQQREGRLPPRTLIETQAASKVVKNSDPSYPSVIDILSVYPSRSLYAIVTLLNKLAELNFNQRQQQILFALLVGTFELRNALWGYPFKRHRPKQVSIPNQFIEVNFWHSLERSLELWLNYFRETKFSFVPVIHWPQMPQSGEISIFSGRIKELLPQIQNKEFSAIVTTIPRPNQAFWTLCAIWSGWLEGRELVKPLKSALLRKRYDWGWHCRALATTFQELTNYLPENIPCLALIEEYEANFLAAALFAADYAHLWLERLFIRSDQGRAQIHWRIYSLDNKVSPSSLGEHSQRISKVKTHIAKKIHDHIQQTLEPASYAQIHSVALTSTVHAHKGNSQNLYPEDALLEIFPFQSVPDYPNFFLNLFEEAIQSSLSLIPLKGDEKSLESHGWWIASPHLEHTPFSDVVENAIFDYLLNHASASYWEIDQAICSRFEHISVPSLALIQECLESYANYDQTTKTWTLRKEESPIQRSHDLDEIQANLLSLGNRLNYCVKDEHPLIWIGDQHEKVAIWHIQSNAHIGNLLQAYYSNVGATYLVIPGSRVNLILYKLHRYPFLTQLLDKQIRIIRFRQIRWIASQPDINRPLFDEWLATDPIRYQSSQLSLW
ncbi:MAG: hypothetical protein N3D16_05620 [Anaerolineales bacterium]|nr:hypothetical protein [Anaerolineales bacterium]